MADGNGSATTPRWRYSPEITLGHLIQAVTLIAMVGGGAITSYVSLRSDIQSASARAAEAAAALNARLVIIETRREVDDRFQVETRRDLGRLLDTVTDIRVQLVGKQDKQGSLTPPLPPRAGLP